ncbi:MAG TPA: ABC transporter permease subunit [Verrucomicrobiae bacterium]|nr:ABC transporter permease subunit [Verrucomicrobiae bacterium]
MNVRVSTVWILFRHELRMILRDRRTLITAVIVPMLVTPLVLASSSWTRKQREAVLQSTTYKYAVAGEARDQIREWITTAIEQRDLKAGTNGAGLLRLEEETAITNAVEALHAATIHFFVEGVREVKTNSTGEVTPEPLPTLRFVYRGDRDDSLKGQQELEEQLERMRKRGREDLLRERGFPVRVEQVAVVEPVDLASKAQVAGRTLGKMISLFLLVLVFSGGAVVANDLLAGEKERGTLETLLTSSASRTDIIASKQLVIFAIATFITIMQVMNLLVYVGFKVIPVSANLSAAVTPAVALLLLALFLPMTGLVAGLLLLGSGYAKTYKEAQLYFLPMLVICVLPALAPIFPDLPLRSLVVLIPIANVGVAAKEILVGVFDWPMIALAWIVTAGTGLWVTRITISLLSAERLMNAGGGQLSPTDGAGRFSRHVVAWFATLWAVLWVVNSYTARADIRVQLLVNLVGLFLGASLLILWRYPLNWGEMLAWRGPKPLVWLGVVCAIPGGVLTASGLARLASQFVPVSEEMLEEFSRTLIPEGITTAELLFFLAVLPGFCEEFAFRGLLLHGLRRRFHPVALVVVVGLVFGIFHFALFRFAGTAFLGMLLAAVTLITGSIFPAMVWHAGNNALGVIASQAEVPVAELDGWMYGAGVVLLAVAFWIFWRERQPAAGLRWRR